MIKILNSSSVRRQLVYLLPLLIISTIVMKLIDNQLTSDLVPAGIISFQLAGSIERVVEVVSHWGPELQRLAAFHLGLDYLYLIIYSSFLLVVARQLLYRVLTDKYQLVNLLPYSAVVAGACDFLENIFATILLVKLPSLADSEKSSMIYAVDWMYWLALLKLSLLFVCFIFIIYCLIRYPAKVR